MSLTFTTFTQPTLTPSAASIATGRVVLCRVENCTECCKQLHTDQMLASPNSVEHRTHLAPHRAQAAADMWMEAVDIVMYHMVTGRSRTVDSQERNTGQRTETGRD